MKFGFWIARKRTMNARPRKPDFCATSEIVKTGGGGNSETKFGDIRTLDYEIGVVGRELDWAGRGPDDFFNR
ncbi:hypothetical protein M2189_002369 [Bradyrhizobium japonicum]|uniref:hypothetical protein n=1 Tax=Bradyrhizobium japonicum TaxID=375 RepID=UPI0021697EC9|nr:hypothetical protein [Bradyrhizobium japonicum]MCS3498672.1 hypothetical protein [Bradyrhizobium japonicum]MCS3959166.1 hypothetical protein [Bradyrhizobium japonicum]MCS4000921.1 hypothetical protein [Bradyrhizobium japonicum]